MSDNEFNYLTIAQLFAKAEEIGAKYQEEEDNSFYDPEEDVFYPHQEDKLEVLRSLFQSLRAKYWYIPSKTKKLICRKEYADLSTEQIVLVIREKLVLNYNPLTESEMERLNNAN